MTPKLIGIIYGSWASMIPRKVYLGEISLKFMSGQYFANTSWRIIIEKNAIYNTKIEKLCFHY